MKSVFFLLSLLPLSALAEDSVKFSCELQGLVYQGTTLVTFADPIKQEVILKANAGGYESENETIFEKAGLKVQMAIGSYKGHTDVTAYVSDLKGELLANIVGISEDKSGKVAEFVGAHFFNRDAAISSLIVECRSR
jgi:hypothetical protein